jgi:hypothetical protein
MPDDFDEWFKGIIKDPKATNNLMLKLAKALRAKGKPAVALTKAHYDHNRFVKPTTFEQAAISVARPGHPAYGILIATDDENPIWQAAKRLGVV